MYNWWLREVGFNELSWENLSEVLKSVSFKKTVEISGTWEICTKFPHMIFVVIMFLYVCISAFKAQRIIFYQCYSIFNVNNQNRLIAKDLLINLSKWFYISLDFSWNTFFSKIISNIDNHSNWGSIRSVLFW